MEVHVVPIADIGLGEIFLSVLWFCGLFLWIALAVMIFSDIFSDHELSGWGKAGWTILIIILPLLGVLAYLIFRGESMRKRQQARAEQNEKAFENYVRSAVNSPADDIAKLHDLKERGVIDEAEFQKLKAKITD
jgi:hypothetical protein